MTTQVRPTTRRRHVGDGDPGAPRVYDMYEVVCDHDECGGVVRCVGDRSQALRLSQLHDEQHHVCPNGSTYCTALDPCESCCLDAKETLADAVVSVLGSMPWDEVAPHLGCEDADALADLLDRLGLVEAGRELRAHSCVG